MDSAGRCCGSRGWRGTGEKDGSHLHEAANVTHASPRSGSGGGAGTLASAGRGEGGSSACGHISDSDNPPLSETPGLVPLLPARVTGEGLRGHTRPQKPVFHAFH